MLINIVVWGMCKLNIWAGWGNYCMQPNHKLIRREPEIHVSRQALITGAKHSLWGVVGLRRHGLRHSTPSGLHTYAHNTTPLPQGSLRSYLH